MLSVTDSSGTTTRTYNDQNQIVSDGTSTLAYDDNGNMTTDDQGHTLVYDAWNRLVEVLNGTTVIQQFTYDGQGRMVTESNWDGGTSTMDIYYNGWQAIQENLGAFDAEIQNVFSPVYVNAVIFRDEDTDDSGTFDDPSERTYLTQDATYNVTGMVSYDSGTSAWGVSERVVYDPYGTASFKDGSWNSSTNTTGIEFLFQGMRYMQDVGLYDDRERPYDAPLGRFLLPDPSGHPNGANNLSFATDDPTSISDPMGLKCVYVMIYIDRSNLPASFNYKAIQQKYFSILGADTRGIVSFAGGDEVHFTLTEKPRPHVTMGGKDVTPALGWNSDHTVYQGELKWNPDPVSPRVGNSYNEDGKTAWVNLQNVAALAPGDADWTDYWANTIAHENFYHGAFSSLFNSTKKDTNDSSPVIESGSPWYYTQVSMSTWVWNSFVGELNLK
jgi:RHS repeat-associated protein